MTTTAMQFGQSTINVVLGEGTVPAKFGTDASGNVTGLVGPDGLLMQAIPAHIRKRRARIRLGRAADGTGVSSTTLRTTQQAWRIPYKVYGFRLGIESNLAAATTFSLCKGAVIGTGIETLDAALDNIANLSSATPFSITWSGSAGATVPARTAADDPNGITWSDWVYQPINPGQLLATRMLWPYPGSTWNYPYSSTGLTESALLTADPDLAVMHWHDTTDRVTGWTSWAVTSANGTGNLSIQYIELLVENPTLTVGVVGDSTTTGQVDSGDAPLAPVWAACESLSDSNLQFSPLCRGWGGKEASQYHAYALELISDYAPDILIYQAWSQNDTAQADNTQEIARALDIVSRCKAAGIVPIILTGIPINTWTSPTYDVQEAARIALNTVVRGLGEIVIDADAVLSNGVSPVADYATVYGTGTHPNTAGYAALVAEYVRAIGQVVGR